MESQVRTCKYVDVHVHVHVHVDIDVDVDVHVHVDVIMVAHGNKLQIFNFHLILNKVVIILFDEY